MRNCLVKQNLVLVTNYCGKLECINSWDLYVLAVVVSGDDFQVIQQEIQMMRECQHPNIVAYYGSYLRYYTVSGQFMPWGTACWCSVCCHHSGCSSILHTYYDLCQLLKMDNTSTFFTICL